MNSITTGVIFVDWINWAQDRNKGRLLWVWKWTLGLKKYGELVAFKNGCVLCSQSVSCVCVVCYLRLRISILSLHPQQNGCLC